MSRRLFLSGSQRYRRRYYRAAGARLDGQAVELQRSPVAGFQYHRGKTVWPLLTIGASLDLVREPDNAYDPQAVRVDWQGQKLGYVPRIGNSAVSRCCRHTAGACLARSCAPSG